MMNMDVLCKFKLTHNIHFYEKKMKIFFSAKETHQAAQANEEKNRKLREAFGIQEYDQKKQNEQKVKEAKEAERRKAELASKQYT